MDTNTNTARLEFVAKAEEVGSYAEAEETAILSVGREFLPACAIAVLDGGEPTAEYWAFLQSETEKAQSEHDAEYQGRRSLSEALEWARSAEAGEYLAHHEAKPGNSCGYSEQDLSEIKRQLRAHDLSLTADDVGLVASKGRVDASR